MSVEPQHLYDRLRAGWSLETSSQWTAENPARGQCSVTALVVQDVLGGDILKTRTAGGTHFYNRIDGVRWDFTISQFDRPIPFEDLPSDRNEAMADTSPQQYRTLRQVLGLPETEPAAQMRKRPSARLLVLDPAGRVLLFLFDHKTGPLAGTAFWATPGGSLDPGETYAQAARRELLEETGIDADVGESVAVRHLEFMTPQGEMVEAEEHYFLVRSAGVADHGRNPDPVEREIVAEARWWRLDEIPAATGTIYPENIVEMVGDALAAAR